MMLDEETEPHCYAEMVVDLLIGNINALMEENKNQDSMIDETGKNKKFTFCKIIIENS